MKYLLDTNIRIYLIKKKPLQVLAKFQTLEVSEIGISSITVAELEYGVSKSQQQSKNRDALMQFLIPLEIIEFNQEAAIAYGNIRSNLESRGLVIGAMDMLIAAHALSLEVTLVSNNVREFSRISNLFLENRAE
ncbi:MULTISPECIES: type II toxin-antitoxin system VapC family toxin [unclassified Synechocystis]|uniref:type II toxin-antitoxin system tRNA(fMet)-specific endonuclease VapC n=1 Tax=unclassified Synechocystis TaxID=2640012 RepID=UPI00041B6534|nr:MULTISPECIES: type II toxin-antitoxin system VapC family toxin [unclassified Synechocystis]AIE75612.1 VapC toxin protein [Synechocystis sp. PCC 6714]MCT0253807.1 type II toxin-antitoxin system VapC family toxin [Synechocystis sp. CS-94]